MYIFFSSRNQGRADESVSKLSQSAPYTKVTFIRCDLADLASVQSAAKQFLSSSSRLDVLMCNAGIVATPAELSKNSYAQSKLAHLLYPLELAAHHHSVTSVAIHPGLYQN